jgi:dTDP-4-amino-4,6-dideoxygalactose transaminase
MKHPEIILPDAKNSNLFTGVEALAHVWHLFVIRSEHRDKLQKHLSELGVQTLIHYPIAPHKQRAYKYYQNFCYLSQKTCKMNCSAYQ